MSLALSLLLIVSSYEALKAALPGQSLADDIADLGKHLNAGTTCLLQDIQTHLSAAEGCQPIKPSSAAQPHTTTLSSGILQIAGVIALSFLWFYTFMLFPRKSPQQKWYTSCSIIATLAYVFGMFNAYQPAVFVAALVAIFVAAEHSGKLSEQEDQLKKQGAQLADSQAALAEQGRQLATSKQTLEQTSDQLNKVVKNVVRISNSIQVKLNQAGIEIFMQEVYGAYSRAETIYAVFQDHQIEEAWWTQAEKAFSATTGLARVWDWYQAPDPPAPGKPAKLTLYAALTQRRGGSGAATDRDGVMAGYFVSHMPMPGSLEWDQEDRKVRLFGDLLGLAWECLVLDKVRKYLQRKWALRTGVPAPDDAGTGSDMIDTIGEWVSKPFCWAHATDKEVLQVVQRSIFEDSTVLKTADLNDTTENQLDEALSRKLIESTQAEIKRYLRRGMRAEEYLCAVLCYARNNDPDAVLHTPDQRLAETNTAACLEKLNLNLWLDFKQDTSTNPARATVEGRRVMKKICVAIFCDFIDMCWNKPVAEGALASQRLKTSMFLAQEVL